jgi:pimeloyl-ACP methyl ester carboxylesterase
MDRRELLRAGGALASVTALAGTSLAAAPVDADAASAAPATAGARTYVLVHGAWHGGWCWREVARRLRAAGHTVFTPTLTGLGERAHLASPTVDLSTHALDVVNLFEFEELSDVILVGHSYAGHVIPLVADAIAGRIRHLVFLDAVVARDGQPFLAPEVGAARARAARDGYLDPPPGLAFFGVPADHPLAPWVQRRLVPHPLGTLRQVVRFRNGGHAPLPKTFIRCLRRRDMSQPDPIEPQVKGQAGWAWKTIDTGHDAMVTAPEELTRLLLGTA